MRYPAGEKLEIIHLVERSHLSVKRTLASLGISRPTFYRWLWRYEHFGLSGLEDRRCGPSRVWNRVPESIRQQVVELALEQALNASGLDRATARHRPRLLSDNGSSYIATELAQWIEDHQMKHVRGAPYHPMTQGKIERWHQTLKNRILLEHYYLPGDLEASIEAFVEHYNHHRYHESLSNLTPADVYFRRGETLLRRRAAIKRKTLEKRRLQHAKAAA